MASKNSWSLNLGIPATPNTTNPAIYGEIVSIHNALRTLATALDAYTGVLPKPEDEWSSQTLTSTLLTGNGTRMYVKFSQAATYGQPVNFHSSGGELRARLAKEAVGYQAQAFCSCASVAVDEFGEVQLWGVLNISGVTPGDPYWLATSAGGITSVPGMQLIGFGIANNAIFFDPVRLVI